VKIDKQIMSSKLYKIDKDTLEEVDFIELAFSEATALSIQHIHDPDPLTDPSTTITLSESIPFTITILDKHVPYIYTFDGNNFNLVASINAAANLLNIHRQGDYIFGTTNNTIRAYRISN